MKTSRLFAPVLIFLISYTIKVHRIEKGNFVIWDEAHFGKFSQKYLDREFYFDVHPPLGKMLTALSGFIYGQSKDFEFSSKEHFPDKFDYQGMRRFHSLVSSLTPLFGYLILREFRISLRRSLLLSMLFLFENGVVSISRLILLDSHLLSFTAGTLYLLTLLYTRRNKNRRFFGREDVVLLFLGVFLGCVISIKWIGCLTMLQVGIYIIFDLYMKILFMDLKKFSKYFFKRAVFLILVPAVIYVGLFFLHFKIVNKSGQDDGFMSSEFQLSLENNVFQGIKKYISYGKQVTVKNKSGYLHSHMHHYPDEEPEENSTSNSVEKAPDQTKTANEAAEGKTQKLKYKKKPTARTSIPLQVSAYTHKDRNNNFYFQKITENTDTKYIKDGDEVALLHSETKSYIESTKETAYMSQGYKIIGNRGPLTNSGVWKVEIHSDSVKKEENIKAISTRFYLKNSGMYLCTSGKNYPSWGYEQGEIACKEEKDSSCLWNIEENFFTKHNDNPVYAELQPNFFSRFVEHQALMFVTNKSFVQDPDLEPERIVSKPYEWPLLTRGLRMSQWHEHHKFYMFMNPLILYATTFSILLAPVVLFVGLVQFRRSQPLRQSTVGKSIKKRRMSESERRKIRKGREAAKRDCFFFYISFGGWVFHYVAFFLVGRVLYLHHYFPALFMATLNLCYLLRNISFKKCLLFVFLCTAAFLAYSPLTYGFLDENKVKHLKLLREWDFVD